MHFRCMELKDISVPLVIVANDEGLCAVDFGSLNDANPALRQWIAQVGEGELIAVDDDELLAEAAEQLRQYFAGERQNFHLPLHLYGSDFERTVWRQLQAIPYGETCSYGEVAHQIGKPGAARAIGGANHRNPLPVIIPCHRVIGANGRLTGYGGGLTIKQQLLLLEQGGCA